jgi:hypothetical protein
LLTASLNCPDFATQPIRNWNRVYGTLTLTL